MFSMEWTEKYRPRKFSELVGQDRAAKVLENDVDNPKGTYILKGKGGGGKTTAARIFAAALNCEDRKDGNPCGECLSCRTILSGANSPSVEEISAAVANSVEDARNLVNDTTRATAGLKRVFILDECHMMSRNAWDALLKLLENPPKDTHFLLVTTEYHKIPDTIKTRSRTISFDPITDDKVAEHLKWVCEQEGHDDYTVAQRQLAGEASGEDAQHEAERHDAHVEYGILLQLRAVGEVEHVVEHDDSHNVAHHFGRQRQRHADAEHEHHYHKRVAHAYGQRA